MIAVYRQPAYSATTWAARGVTAVIGYESNERTVSFADFDAAWTAAHCAIIREPSADPDLDKKLAGLLFPIDEPDNLIVSLRDNGKPFDWVYQLADAFHALHHPKAPVWINLGIEQLRWLLPSGQPKVDYARLCRAADDISVDYYPVQRGKPLSDYTDLIETLTDRTQRIPSLAIIEASNQHLDPRYYPPGRAPTPTEFLTELARLQLVDVPSFGLFPQQIGQDGSGFQYDAMPPELVDALMAVALPPATVIQPA